MSATVLPALLGAAAVIVAGAGRAGLGAQRPIRRASDRRGPAPRVRRGARGAAPAEREPARASRSPRRVVLFAVASGPAAVVTIGPMPSLVLAVAAVLVPLELARRARRQRQRARDAAFPDLVDLFRIAAAAGHPVHRCVEVVAARAPAPVRPPLATTLTRVQRGVPLADALVVLGPELGTSGPVLTDALRAALRTGSPLAPVLDRVVLVARDRRARTAQTAARRLPVTMLFPLVCCVLPAFGLLAVVPLLAGSLGSIVL